MLKFKLNVYYGSVHVYESADFEFSIIIEKLNDVIDRIYDFDDRFGKVLDTCRFIYVIEEVNE